MRPIQKFCSKRGLPIYVWEYPSLDESLCAHSQNLCATLQEIAACHPGEEIHFITHSVGALILRQTLNIPDCPKEAKIGKAVLIAPPNQGSSLAQRSKNIPPARWMLRNRLGRELMCYDACAIQAIGPFPETLDILVIAGSLGNYALFDAPNDGALLVSETALETPFCFACFPVGHSGLLSYPKALETLYYFLQYPKVVESQDWESHDPTTSITNDYLPEEEGI